MRRSLSPHALAVLSVLLCPSVAGAQPTPPEIEAQQLHDRAMAIVEQGQHATGCAMLDQVVSLLPGSIGAKIAAAECYVRWDRTAAALARYQAIPLAAATPPQNARVQARIAALLPRVSHLVVTVPERVRALPGLEIRWDGQRLNPAWFGLPVPVDRGRHRFEVLATGKVPLQGTIDIGADAETVSVGVSMPPDSNPLPLPRR